MNGLFAGNAIEGPVAIKPFQSLGGAEAGAGAEAAGPAQDGTGGNKFKQAVSEAMAASGSAQETGPSAASGAGKVAAAQPLANTKTQPQKEDVSGHKAEAKQGDAEASLKGKDKDKNAAPAAKSPDANFYFCAGGPHPGTVPESKACGLEKTPSVNAAGQEPAPASAKSGASTSKDAAAVQGGAAIHTDAARPDAAHQEVVHPDASEDPAGGAGAAVALADTDIKAAAGGKTISSPGLAGGGPTQAGQPAQTGDQAKAAGGVQDGPHIQKLDQYGQNQSGGSGQSGQFEFQGKYKAQYGRGDQFADRLSQQRPLQGPSHLPAEGPAPAQASGQSQGTSGDNSGQPAFSGQSQGQTAAQSAPQSGLQFGLQQGPQGGPAPHGATNSNPSGSGQTGWIQKGSVAATDEKPFVVTGQDTKSIEVRIEPEGLGKMDIRLILDKGHVNAHINAAESLGKAAVEGNLPGIISKLADEGINIGSFSVSLGNGKKERGWREGAGSGEESRVEKTGRVAGRSGPEAPAGLVMDHGETAGAGRLSLFA